VSRGYCGIGIVAGKTPDNVGGLWRAAHAFGAAFIFTAGHRYPDERQPTDTSRAERHVPLFEYSNKFDFTKHLPRGCELVAIDCRVGQHHRPSPLHEFKHPKRAVYALGAEDRGLPEWVLSQATHVVEIPSDLCLNVATAGAIVLYDRQAKQ
jgi:tRNA (guanosine-2'-O-)-methyltransferase